jgi:hypothetical protein
VALAPLTGTSRLTRQERIKKHPENEKTSRFNRRFFMEGNFAQSAFQHNGIRFGFLGYGFIILQQGKIASFYPGLKIVSTKGGKWAMEDMNCAMGVSKRRCW